MAEKKKQVAVVVPVWRAKLTADERCSLEQLQRVLGNYPRFFVAPLSLQPAYGRLGRGFQTTRFPDSFFRNYRSYSHLLLSPSFYEAFAAYEYILIYQLDAFVFSDRLRDFCAQGYDYIGAPVRYSAPVWRLADARVGNGGLSLRRVSSCRRIARLFAEGCMPRLLWEVLSANEDACFAWAGRQPELAFHVPSGCEAMEFAIQGGGRHVAQRLASGWRPFGCHGWPKEADALWRPLLVETLGHPVGPSQMQQGRQYIPAWQEAAQARMQARGFLPIACLYGLVREGRLIRAAGIVRDAVGRTRFVSSGCGKILEDIAYLYRLAASFPVSQVGRAELLYCLLEAAERVLMIRCPADIPQTAVTCLLTAADTVQKGNRILEKLHRMDYQLREGKEPLIPVEPCYADEKSVRKRLRIYVVMHKLVPAADDPAYQPILVGAGDRAVPEGILTDCHGENISERNPQYCELTALYWAWKNDELPEYVGMCHYRRYLAPRSPEKFRGVFSGVHILEVMQQCDVLLPQAQDMTMTVAEQFCSHHGKRPLLTLEAVMCEMVPECMEAFYTVMMQKKAYFCNIFVMRREEFQKYMAWLFPLLFATEKRMGGFTADGRDSYQQRLGGFLAERLLNVYVAYRHLRVYEAGLIVI